MPDSLSPIPNLVMKTGEAFVAGVVSGAVMRVLMLVARTVLNMEVKLELLFGTMIGLAPGTTAWAHAAS